MCLNHPYFSGSIFSFADWVQRCRCKIYVLLVRSKKLNPMIFAHRNWKIHRVKKTRNYSPPLESSISIWLINLAKKLTSMVKIGGFWMENSPSLRNRGPRGVQQLFLWTLWTNSTTSNDASMWNDRQIKEMFVCGLIFLGNTVIWQLGRTSDPGPSFRPIWRSSWDMGIPGASCIFFSQFACTQWRDGREYCMQLELDNDVGWCLWSGRGLQLQYHVRL